MYYRCGLDPLRGRGTCEGGIVGHAQIYLAVNVLKVTHKGQHAVMRPARHHYCSSLLLLTLVYFL